MAVNLGSVDAVYRLTGKSVETLTNADAEAFLTEAENEIKTLTTKNYIVDELYATVKQSDGTVVKSYDTYFDVEASATPSVYVNGDLLSSGTDYTYSSSNITFASSYSLNAGDKINFFYKPAFFDDLANYIAARNIFMTQVLDSNQSVVQTNIDNLNKHIRQLKRTFARRPNVRGYVDHREDYGIF